jgi:hypothetical protein
MGLFIIPEAVAMVGTSAEGIPESANIFHETNANLGKVPVVEDAGPFTFPVSKSKKISTGVDSISL